MKNLINALSLAAFLYLLLAFIQDSFIIRWDANTRGFIVFVFLLLLFSAVLATIEEKLK